MNKIESAYKEMMEDVQMSGSMIAYCMKDKALELERELTAVTEQRDESLKDSIFWQSVADGRVRTNDDCSVCGGCFMIPGTEPNDDVMNMPCPKCNGHSEDTENLIRERDEAIAGRQAYKLLAVKHAQERDGARVQRDKLAEALARTRNMIKSHPDAAETCATEALQSLNQPTP
tara:strand:- start:110 stop:631 length:522 start_codon:yes stop_codon:yes gene_type:complete